MSNVSDFDNSNVLEEEPGIGSENEGGDMPSDVEQEEDSGLSNFEESGSEEEPEDYQEESEEENPMNVGALENTMFSSEEEESESEEEDNFQKFEDEVKKDYILQCHPESLIHNNKEIETMCKIIRNKDGKIVDKLHKTLPFVTKYERTRLLGARAKQINHGSDPLVEVPDLVIDGYTIALMEFEQKKLPFIIRRPLPNGSCEYWKFSDLEQITY